MSTNTSAAEGTPAATRAGSPVPVPPGTRRLTVLAAAGLGTALVIMIACTLLRRGWMLPHLTMPPIGPPWEIPVRHVRIDVVTYLLWASAVLSAGGLAAGLVAVQRGARIRPRILLAGGLLVIAVLTVLPPAGSTDLLDYAAYGRLLALGHSPYVITPYHLRAIHDAFATSVPLKWDRNVSVYGPLATAEQYLVAVLGGTSPARVVFWLKLANAGAFAGVALVADRLLRGDPAQRLRAHLLWTVNPLLLWDLMAAGHLDVLAAAVGLLGLLVLGRQQPGATPSIGRAAAAGALLGVAADIKINYVLFGIGLAWALRRSLTGLAAAAGAALAVLVPSYAAFGRPAVKALVARRNQASADNFYRMLLPHGLMPHLALLATALVLAVAALVLWRLPQALPDRPAIQPALAVSAAWLFFWPYQLPWYDVMIICLLLLYPASRLDWLVLARLTAGTISNMPGDPYMERGHWLRMTDHWAVHVVAPIVIFAAAIGLVVLCVTGAWHLREPPGRPPGARAPLRPADGPVPAV
jgi:alpha-1,6-mannosyltransferase